MKGRQTKHWKDSIFKLDSLDFEADSFGGGWKTIGEIEAQRGNNNGWLIPRDETSCGSDRSIGGLRKAGFLQLDGKKV